VSIEKTLILVKPDGVRRGLVGEVISRVETKGYSIEALRLLNADRALLEQHYAEHIGKPFYEPLVEFMMSGPIVAMVASGNRVIEGFRSLAGVTDPTVAAPGLCMAQIHLNRLRARFKFSSLNNQGVQKYEFTKQTEQNVFHRS
jgi:nucleoside-diphosphate kinase